MRKPTARQAYIFYEIVKHINTVGYPPTIRELMDATGIRSLRGVTRHLDALEAKGIIARKIGSPRAITILRRAA